MLKRIHIKGYKSLVDLEVELKPLTVLLGPNAAGKSNFLDALQILSRIGTSRTIKDAFDPPYRGKPLESFSFDQKKVKGLVRKGGFSNAFSNDFAKGGLETLIQHEQLAFSIEADLHLSDAVVENVNQLIRDMRGADSEARPRGVDKARDQVREREGEFSRATSKEPAAGKADSPVRERKLRYRIEIEMLPKSGVLRVADEYLAALNSKGEPTGKRQPFIERKGERIHLRREGRSHPTYHDRHLDHSVLSMPHYPPHHPHVVAARSELESWLFYYFEPRERMRAPVPVKEVRRLGAMGEELAAFLNTLKARRPMQFRAIEKSLAMLVREVEAIDVHVNDLGEVDLRIKERGIFIPSRVVSDGTLRMLGLLALTGIDSKPGLIGVEEPENGVHPRRISLIAELLNCQAALGNTQYVVTSHSPLLPDHLDEEALYVVGATNGNTWIEPFSNWGPIGRRTNMDRALEDMTPSNLSVSERILRGDLG